MKKGVGLLLMGLMGCAGRAGQGYCPVASRMVVSTETPAAPSVSAPLPTLGPAPTAAAPAPAAEATASRPVRRVAHLAPPLRPAPARPNRLPGRRATRPQTSVAQTPASHAADGLGKLLLVAAIVAALILGTIVLAFTAPASVLGAIGKGALWALGGVLLVTLLNGAEQALFPDERRK